MWGDRVRHSSGSKQYSIYLIMCLDERSLSIKLKGLEVDEREFSRAKHISSFIFRKETDISEKNLSLHFPPVTFIPNLSRPLKCHVHHRSLRGFIILLNFMSKVDYHKHSNLFLTLYFIK